MKNTVISNTNGLFQHSVHFYGKETELLNLLEVYLIDGLALGEALVVIATRSHAQLLEQKLELKMDLERAKTMKKIIFMDARQALAQFMVRGMPDTLRFLQYMGSMVNRASLHGRVRAYGEMVALLWEEGNTQGALKLEKLWNDLARRNDFTLLCAYPKKLFAAGVPQPICGLHKNVVMQPKSALH